MINMKKQKKAVFKVKRYFKKVESCKKVCKKNWKKVVVVLGVLGLAFYFKNMLVVALVNNRPIFRQAYIKELEAQGGQQVLDGLMTKAMILQEAKSTGVSISQEELDAELVKIEEIAKQQEMTLDELLELQNVKKKELIKQIEIQKIVEKMAGEGVEVSDEEATLYLEENMEYLPKEATQEELINIAKEQLKQQMLNEKIQELIVRIKDEAKVVSWL